MLRNVWFRCALLIVLVCFSSICLAQSQRPPLFPNEETASEQTEPDLAPRRTSPFYEENESKPTQAVRHVEPLNEISTESHTADAPQASRTKTPLPVADFDDETASSSKRSSSGWGPTLFWVAGILSLGWIARQLMRQGNGFTGRSSATLQILNRQCVGPQQQLLLVQCGARMLLVGCSPAGMSTLATYDDPLEVAQIIAGLRPPATPEGMTWKDLFRQTRRDDARDFPLKSVSVTTRANDSSARSQVPTSEVPNV